MEREDRVAVFGHPPISYLPRCIVGPSSMCLNSRISPIVVPLGLVPWHFGGSAGDDNETRSPGISAEEQNERRV